MFKINSSHFFIPPTWLLLLISAALAWIFEHMGFWYGLRASLIALFGHVLYYRFSRTSNHSGIVEAALLLLLIPLHLKILSPIQIITLTQLSIPVVFLLAFPYSAYDKMATKRLLSHAQLSDTHTILNHQALWQMLVYNTVLVVCFTFTLYGMLQLKWPWQADNLRLLGMHTFFSLLTFAVYWARKEKILQTQFVTAHGGEWLRIDAHGLTWQDDGNEWLSINPVGLEWRAMSGQRLFFADQMPNPFHIAWADILDVQLHKISKRDYELNIVSSKPYNALGHTEYTVTNFGQFRSVFILHALLSHLHGLALNAHKKSQP